MKATAGALALLTLLAVPAAGVLDATVRVTHGHPTGLIQPGETINVRVDVTWTGGVSSNWVLFAGLSGSVLPTPSVGASSNITSIFEPGFTVALGTPELGGVTGIDIANGPQGFGCYPWPPPAGGPTGLAGPFIAFDWTAPAGFQGDVTFAFTGAPAAPSVRLFPSTTSPAFVEAQTTFIPVTLTVVPSPGPAGAGLVLAGAAAARRGRRP